MNQDLRDVGGGGWRIWKEEKKHNLKKTFFLPAAGENFEVLFSVKWKENMYLDVLETTQESEMVGLIIYFICEWADYNSS